MNLGPKISNFSIMNLDNLRFKDKFEIILLEFEKCFKTIEIEQAEGKWNLYEHKTMEGLILGTRTEKDRLTIFVAPHSSLFLSPYDIYMSATIFTFHELVDIYRFIYQLHPTLN